MKTYEGQFLKHSYNQQPVHTNMLG